MIPRPAGYIESEGEAITALRFEGERAAAEEEPDGSLTGYAGGLEKKKYLLEIEKSVR